MTPAERLAKLSDESLLKLVNPGGSFISHSDPRYQKAKAKKTTQKRSNLVDESGQLSKEKISQFKKIAQEKFNNCKIVGLQAKDEIQIMFDISMCYLFGWGVGANIEGFFSKFERSANKNFGPAKYMMGNLFYCWAQLLENKPKELITQMKYFGEYLFESPLLLSTKFIPSNYSYKEQKKKNIIRNPKTLYEHAYKWFFGATRAGSIPGYAAFGYMLYHNIGTTCVPSLSRSKAKMIGKIFLERAKDKNDAFAKTVLDSLDNPIMGKPKKEYGEIPEQSDAEILAELSDLIPKKSENEGPDDNLEMQQSPKADESSKNKFDKYKFENLRRHWEEVENSYRASHSHNGQMDLSQAFAGSAVMSAASNGAPAQAQKDSVMTASNGAPAQAHEGSVIAASNGAPAKTSDPEKASRKHPLDDMELPASKRQKLDS